nr:Prolyl 4-hydroxylase alpha-subunit domain containing protein [Haemonchus contortus]
MQLVLGLLALLLVSVNAEVFTSIADVQNLINSEKSIPQILTKYIESEEDRLEHLKVLVKKYEKQNEEATKTDVKDVLNPINAFLFIKKKIFDWKDIEKATTMNKADKFLERVANQDKTFRYLTEVIALAICICVIL